MSRRKGMICCFLMFLATFVASAQVSPNGDVALGASPYAVYDGGDIDNINPVNGNVFLNIPLLSYPQLGHALRLNFRIYYNAKQWYLYGFQQSNISPYQISGTWTYYNGTSTPAYPNTASSAIGVYVARDQHVEFGEDTNTTQQVENDEGYGSTTTTTTYNGYWVREPDGAQHYYADGATQTCTYQNTDNCTFSYAGYSNGYIASDGSGFINNGGGLYSNSITGRDGLIYSIPSGTGSNATEVITDTAGNSISASTSGWTDSVGRVIPGSYSGPGTSDDLDPGFGTISAFDPIPGVTVALPSQCSGATAAREWVVPEPTSNSAPYYLCYTDTHFHTAFNIDATTGSTLYTNVSEAQGTAPTLLTAIVLPNGTAYRFTYDSYLTLSSITFPTGGSIDYTWGNISVGKPVPAGYGGLGTIPVTRVLEQRTLNPGGGQPSGTWKYHRYYNTTGSDFWSVVTDPSANDVEYHVLGTSDYAQNPVPGDVTSRTAYSGCSPHDSSCSSTGTALQTDTYTYESAAGATEQGGAWIAKNLDRRTSTTTTLPSTSGSLTKQTTTAYVPSYGSCKLYSFNGTSTPESGAVSPCYTTDQPQSVAAYDYGSAGSGSPGAILNTSTTNYLWQTSANYLSADLLDLVSSKVITDASKNRASETDYGYDETPSPQGAIGNQTSVTSWLNTGTSPVTKAQYNSQGMPTLTIDALGNQKQINYQCSGSLPSSAVFPYNSSTTVVETDSFGYDCNSGYLTSVKDPNGFTTTYTHDALGRFTEVQYPDGGSKSISFNGDPSPPKVTTTTATGETSGSIVHTVFYDGYGRPTETELTTDPAGADLVETTYDSLGRVASVSNSYRTTSDTTYGITSYLYDALSRKTYQCQPDNSGTPTTTCNPQSSYQSWTYSGNTTTFQDEIGNQWNTTTDGLGRLSMVLEPTNVSPSPSMETDYAYDALSDLVKVDQYGGPKNEANASSIERARGFTYDSLSRLTSSNNPEAGATHYIYDANGNVSKKTDARGVAISYVYDGLNRLTKKSYSDGFTVSALFGYDNQSAGGGTLSGVSNGIGRLSQLSETLDSSITNISYDKMGRIANKQECIPGDCNYDINVTAIYDLAGNVSSLTNGSKAQPITFSYTYDGAGRLNALTSSLTGGYHPAKLFSATSTSPPSYTAGGMLVYAALGTPSSGSAAFTLNQGYDTRQRPTFENVLNSASATLYSVCTTCDPNPGYQANGNVINVEDSIMGTWSLTYDHLNRLSTASISSGPYNGQFGCWTYDTWGNRTLEAVSKTPCTGSPTPTTWATYNTSNQVTGTTQANAGYTYDAAGNVLNDGVNQYLYDGESRICAVKSPTPGVPMMQYIYDPAGNRVGKGTITTFSCNKATNGFADTVGYVLGVDGEQLTEINGSGTWQHTNAFANGKLLATYSGTDTYFAFSDWLGTKRLVAGIGGCLSYDVSLPFGNSLSTSGNCPDPSEHHYTGKERDSETGEANGNDYFGARYYQSSMGRFLIPDWAAKAEPVPYARLDNPQSLNLYGYVLNNPLSSIDPDGHIDCTGANSLGAGCQNIAQWNTDHEVSSTAWGSSGFGNVAVSDQNGTYTAQQEPTSQNGGGNKSDAIYRAFVLGSQYGEQAIGSDDQTAVLVRHVGFTDNVQIPGDTLDEGKASSGWEDPLTSFHGGAESFYFGGPLHLFGVDAGHVAAGAGTGAAPGLEAHHDTFGPLNPIHWLFEALPSLFVNTRNSAVARPYTCSISGGCAAQ